MDVSVIIVNYHTSSLVKDCIASILRHTEGVTYEIIVVDNATEPDLPHQMGAAFPDAPARCVMLEENVGFGRANNAGFDVARGRNLFCLNPDTILLNNAIRILSDYLDTHPGTGAAGANLYDEHLRPMHSFRRRFPGPAWEFNELLHLVPDRLRYGRNRHFNASGQPLDVAYVTGADLMIPRRVLDATGGFDPDFFMYYEETDLCRRIRAKGFGIVSVPEARIQHLEGGSFADKRVNETRILRSETSRLLYYRKNAGKAARATANAIYGAFLLSRLILRPSPYYKTRYRTFRTLLRNGKNHNITPPKSVK